MISIEKLYTPLPHAKTEEPERALVCWTEDYYWTKYLIHLQGNPPPLTNSITVISQNNGKCRAWGTQAIIKPAGFSSPSWLCLNKPLAGFLAADNTEQAAELRFFYQMHGCHNLGEATALRPLYPYLEITPEPFEQFLMQNFNISKANRTELLQILHSNNRLWLPLLILKILDHSGIAVDRKNFMQNVQAYEELVNQSI